MFGLVAEMRVGTSVTPVEVHAFNSNLQLLTPASHQFRPWEAVVMAQVSGFLSPTWETWVEFSAPSFRTLAVVVVWVLNKWAGMLSL